MRAEVIRYSAVGVLNTVVGFAAIVLGLAVLGMTDVSANLFGYTVGWTLSYLLNRRWTFIHRGSVAGSLARFLIVSAVAYSANLLVVVLLHRQFGVNVYLAQFLGAATYTLVGFVGSYFYAFSRRAA